MKPGDKIDSTLFAQIEQDLKTLGKALNESELVDLTGKVLTLKGRVARKFSCR